ncbi:hypothetical protein [Rhizobium sp. R693]|uniref:hypothetical protein n=1 Tax=Rhizobium sp. R693 TaxID=1764276 RepID=UPI000B52E901|nr:hypothetical protein [Rhizobium sp. R693]OWV84611.1 hypothetical protein ATY79_11900 [Rhizobium sp. R693]
MSAHKFDLAEKVLRRQSTMEPNFHSNVDSASGTIAMSISDFDVSLAAVGRYLLVALSRVE